MYGSGLAITLPMVSLSVAELLAAVKRLASGNGIASVSHRNNYPVSAACTTVLPLLLMLLLLPMLSVLPILPAGMLELR